MGSDGRKPCPGASALTLAAVILLLAFLILSLAHPVGAMVMVMGLIGLLALAIFARAWGKMRAT